MWRVTDLVDVKPSPPGVRGRHWAPDIEHTRYLPTVPGDALRRRPGWPS